MVETKICKCQKKIDVEKLENIREKYSEKTKEIHLEKHNFENPQEQWDQLMKWLKNANLKYLFLFLLFN